MNRKVIKTNDGSVTIYIEDLNESYHSKHGAIQEAYHVFINQGLDLFPIDTSISILEIGFGTGLNAFITFLEQQKRNLNIEYVGVEAYPISIEEVNQLNYVEQLQAEEFQIIFDTMHQFNCNEAIQLNENFSLLKRKQFFEEINDKEKFNLIYFDAFGFTIQPDLWNETIFQKMYDALLPNGVLVTYACRSSIKKAMLNVGFTIKKLPGAPGKREMLRATKC